MNFHAGSHLLSNNSVLKGSTVEKGRKQSVFCTIILQFRHSCKIQESPAHLLLCGNTLLFILEGSPYQASINLF